MVMVAAERSSNLRWIANIKPFMESAIIPPSEDVN